MFGFISDNLMQFAGSGFLFVLLLAGILFLGFRLSPSSNKTMTVWFPLFVLAVFFCPIWFVYAKMRNDSEILYRVLWLIPFGMVICYALVELITLVPKKYKFTAFLGAVIVIMLSGRYVYSNRQFSRADNVYHIPQEIVDVCDTIIVPGREVRACMPKEFIQYTRQYSSLVWLTYGRSIFMGIGYDNPAVMALEEDVVDTKTLTDELLKTKTHYLVVREETVFSEEPDVYGYKYMTSCDGYKIFLNKFADPYLAWEG